MRGSSQHEAGERGADDRRWHESQSQLAVLHPDEDWHRWISPGKVPEVQTQLDDAGPNAVALVVYAFRSDPR